jgi:hypothetical protein
MQAELLLVTDIAARPRYWDEPPMYKIHSNDGRRFLIYSSLDVAESSPRGVVFWYFEPFRLPPMLITRREFLSAEAAERAALASNESPATVSASPLPEDPAAIPSTRRAGDTSLCFV